MTRLTVTIPAATAPAVNAALEAIAGPDAAATFHVHPPADADGTPDTSVLVASWDLDATGHAAMQAAIAKACEDNARTGTGDTLRTADIKVGPEPRLAVKTTAADLARQPAHLKEP